MIRNFFNENNTLIFIPEIVLNTLENFDLTQFVENWQEFVMGLNRIYQIHTETDSDDENEWLQHQRQISNLLRELKNSIIYPNFILQHNAIRYIRSFIEHRIFEMLHEDLLDGSSSQVSTSSTEHSFEFTFENTNLTISTPSPTPIREGVDLTNLNLNADLALSTSSGSISISSLTDIITSIPF